MDHSMSLIGKLFQLLASVFTVLVNLYCMLVFVCDKQMWKLDYFYVMLQTVFDFLFTGLYITVYSFFKCFLYFESFCHRGSGALSIYNRYAPLYASIPDEPEYCLKI